MRRRAEALVTAGQQLPPPRWEAETPDDEPELGDAPLTTGDPIEGLRLPCACGHDDCDTELQFYRDGEYENLVLTFAPATEHFVIDPAVLGALLGTLAR